MYSLQQHSLLYAIFIATLPKLGSSIAAIVKRAWRYQRGNKNPYITLLQSKICLCLWETSY